MLTKAELRRAMRAERAAFVQGIPDSVRSLILNRPPTEIVDFLHEYPTLGLFLAQGDEAPTLGWIRWFHEQGWQIALPRIADRHSDMEFRIWQKPWDESELEEGLMRIPQPRTDAPLVVPDALIVPGVAFTHRCERLGQGGGFYDRWLASHPPVNTIGLAWDVQMVDALPIEPHDQPLTAVVTPTRIYWRDE